VTGTELVLRARSAKGKNTVYKLGKGGYRPGDAHPGSNCDCTGYAAWIVGLSRKQPDTIGWVETSRIVKDATGEQQLFFQTETPEIGDFAVYGDWIDQDGSERQGHIGLITSVVTKVTPTGSLQVVPHTVIHCSSGNYKLTKDAILETAPFVFLVRKAIYVRFKS
jgi:hypothetical protein